jgi:hypothetical protein
LVRVTQDWGRQVAKAVTLAEAGQRDSAHLIAGLSNYLSEEQKTKLLLPSAVEFMEPVHRHFNGYRPAAVDDVEELSRRMTERLFAVSLPSDMLRKVDMMSMRAGIEVRVPFSTSRWWRGASGSRTASRPMDGKGNWCCGPWPANGCRRASPSIGSTDSRSRSTSWRRPACTRCSTTRCSAAMRAPDGS